MAEHAIEIWTGAGPEPIRAFRHPGRVEIVQELAVVVALHAQRTQPVPTYHRVRTAVAAAEAGGLGGLEGEQTSLKI